MASRLGWKRKLGRLLSTTLSGTSPLLLSRGHNEKVCDDILRYFRESGIDNKSNGFYLQIAALKKAGKTRLENNLWRILKQEVKEIYSQLFKKKRKCP